MSSRPLAGLDERARSTFKKDDFDFRPMQKGITLLKFGSRGPAHEKVLNFLEISASLRGKVDGFHQSLGSVAQVISHAF